MAKRVRTEHHGSEQRIEAIRQVLATVTDPEIPVVNIVEMGMIADVRIEKDTSVVDLTPTFAGCPAIDMIQENIRNALDHAGEPNIIVNVVYDPPWTTDRITESCREKLKAFGLAPPGKSCSGGPKPHNLEKTRCPFCDSTNTVIESLFGPTLCRSIHYCHDCLQSFEHFKEV